MFWSELNIQGGPSLSFISINGFGPGVLSISIAPVIEKAIFVIGHTSAHTQSPFYPTGHVYFDPQSGFLLVVKAA